MIQRYLYGAPADTNPEDWHNKIGMWPDENGAYVLTIDHLAEIAKVEAELAAAVRWAIFVACHVSSISPRTNMWTNAESTTNTATIANNLWPSRHRPKQCEREGRTMIWYLVVSLFFFVLAVAHYI